MKKAKQKKEYDANLFAIKFFQYKKETDYLKTLFKWINYLLESYKVKIQFNFKVIDNLFEKYKQDRRTYGSLQFILMNEALKDNKEFEQVFNEISNGHLHKINKSIILRKNIDGSELVSECLEFIFSLHDLHPVVEIDYGPRLGFQTLEEEF